MMNMSFLLVPLIRVFVFATQFAWCRCFEYLGRGEIRINFNVWQFARRYAILKQFWA